MLVMVGVDIYISKPHCNIVPLNLLSGSKAVGYVIALRTYPLQIKSHQQSSVDGSRVHWVPEDPA